VRRESARLRAAAQAFEAMGLPAQASATRALADDPHGQP
jgi:hypothetical protein